MERWQSYLLKRQPKAYIKCNVCDLRFTVILDLQTHAPSQGTNYDRTFADGSLLWTPSQIIMSHTVLTMRELRCGFFGEIFLRGGRCLVIFFGFMVNVHPSIAFQL